MVGGWPPSVLQRGRGATFLMSLDFERKGHVATLALNRPEALNALDRPLIAELHAAIRRRPVLLAERMPGHPGLDQRRVSEKASTDDGVVGIVELEQQRLTGL